jgi:hypothetical protein
MTTRNLRLIGLILFIVLLALAAEAPVGHYLGIINWTERIRFEFNIGGAREDDYQMITLAPMESVRISVSFDEKPALGSILFLVSYSDWMKCHQQFEIDIRTCVFDKIIEMESDSAGERQTLTVHYTTPEFGNFLWYAGGWSSVGAPNVRGKILITASRLYLVVAPVFAMIVLGLAYLLRKETRPP